MGLEPTKTRLKGVALDPLYSAAWRRIYPASGTALRVEHGGVEPPNLLLAKQALSQLS